MIPDIPGLRYVPNYLDASTHDELRQSASSGPWQAAGSQRRVQIYGYTYDYLNRSLKRTDNLPAWASTMAARLQRDGLSPNAPDQLNVTEYEPGQGIYSHVDVDFFDDTIVSISLGSVCVMEFTLPHSDAKKELLLEPASALILSGDARSRWKHAIPPRTSDEWMGRTLERTRRISLTFRKVL